MLAQPAAMVPALLPAAAAHAQPAPENDTLALMLIAALPCGYRLVVSAPELDIADIPLKGSSQALAYVEACVAEED